MDVPLVAWILTITAVVGLLLFDFFAHVRKAHEPTLREAAVWSGVYVGLGLLFGLLMLVMAGPDPALEYYAGYLTEKALSTDNLFVFLIIISSLRVPRRYLGRSTQHHPEGEEEQSGYGVSGVAAPPIGQRPRKKHCCNHRDQGKQQRQQHVLPSGSAGCRPGSAAHTQQRITESSREL